MLLGLPGAKAGKMFGYEAYYVFGKMFACIYGDGVGIKVPEEYRQDEESFLKAVEFVRQIALKGK